jgi:thiol:disulfide interchange protein/DsbC/DsbD-like thiol-disulfide interchange protein
MRTLSTIFIAVATAALFTVPADAQVRIGGALSGLEGATAASDQPVTLSSQFTPATAQRPAVLMITADVASGWHVYSLTQPPGGPTKTKIELAPDSPAKLLGPFQATPAPTTRIDQEAWVGLTIEEHDGRVTWYAPIELNADANSATAQVTGEVRMLACKESCIPVNLNFTARQGPGVPIGPLDVVAGHSEAGGASRNDAIPSAAGSQTPATVSFQPEGSEVTLTGRLTPATVRPGDTAALTLTLAPAANWHVYAHADRDDQVGSKPTLIAFDAHSGLEASRPTTTTPVVTDNSVPEFGPMHYHKGAVTWTVPIRVPTDAKPGTYPIAGNVGYQACETRDDGLGSCELPKGAHFTTTLTVGTAIANTPATVSFTTTTYKDAADTAAAWASHWVDGIAVASNFTPSTPATASRSSTPLALVLGAALLGGMILNVMPCVLPVIGLKIMAFAEQGGESRGRIFRLNLAYAAGLISVFLVLATLASLVQLGIANESYGWGELYTLLWFKVSMIALVFAMALSFLGVWEIPIPGFAGSGTAARLATREGYTGAVCKGIFTTILATPCSGPFLGPVFGFTIAQPPWMTYLIFLFVGLGMAAPYLVIGAFPSLIHRLPRPGAWMGVFKELMGFLLLATVVYLMSTISQAYFIATLALLVGIWFACWLIGRTPLTASEGARRTAWAGGIMSALLIGVLAFRFLTPGQYELPWQPYSPTALAEAQAQGKTVLVDFTADWCLTCKTNLKLSINRSQVRNLVERNGVVTLIADWTDGNPTVKQALEALNSRSIPLLAIYPADPMQDVIVLPDVVTQTDVLEALRRAGPSRTAGNMADAGTATTPLN